MFCFYNLYQENQIIIINNNLYERILTVKEKNSYTDRSFETPVRCGILSIL
jgi:hypothetical protein